MKQGTIRRKFIFGKILLNSILIFQCYDCIKTIDIPNFIINNERILNKIYIGEYFAQFNTNISML